MILCIFIQTNKKSGLCKNTKEFIFFVKNEKKSLSWLSKILLCTFAKKSAIGSKIFIVKVLCNPSLSWTQMKFLYNRGVNNIFGIAYKHIEIFLCMLLQA